MSTLKKFELVEFKKAMGLTKIKFHELKTKDGLRFKAFCSDSDGNELEVITTIGFDHSSNVYVYFDMDSGLYTLSNKSGSAVDTSVVAFEL